MLSRAQIVTYDREIYPFARVLEAMVFKVPSLPRLHAFVRAHKQTKFGRQKLTYNDNLSLRGMIQNLPDDSVFFQLYHRFVRKVVAPRFGGRISYSNHPKMRVHLAGTPCMSKWHRDADITKRPEQINAFLPFTPCFDTNTLWCESDYARHDYQPIELEYGQILFFDGGFLTHGTVDNETDVTRVSLDFRFAIKNQKVEPPWSEILSGRPSDLMPG